MNIVTFCEIDESVFDTKHSVSNFHSGTDGNGDIAIMDINSIFDFEENKHNAFSDKYVSVAILDEESDYDAFKNFGIDSWIKREDIDEINNLINLLEKRFLS